MKYLLEYLEEVVKITPKGEVTTEEDEINGLSGESVYIDGKCSDIFVAHVDYLRWIERVLEESIVDERYNVGDWVVDEDGYAWFIEEINPVSYKLVSKSAQRKLISRSEAYTTLRPWTIDDAKAFDYLMVRSKDYGYVAIIMCSQGNNDGLICGICGIELVKNENIHAPWLKGISTKDYIIVPALDGQKQELSKLGPNSPEVIMSEEIRREFLLYSINRQS